ncbi:hypothetical protein [Amycolatopsis kentuckyensis]|uniref:hypothetical protein n=1 Tax=Amycolatopsis kentuckyensis TaxID=218823 RepID=UPI000A3774E7|nr:hypothetical protein [Amycolatopsis kentuckyensis]
MECASCDAGIDHCHGTLVVHPEGGFAECTDQGCADGDRVRHGLIVDCQGVGGGCGCATAPRKSLLRRAS